MLTGTFCNTASRNFKEVMKFLFGFERVEYGSVFTRNHMCRDPLVKLYSCLINLMNEVATLLENSTQLLEELLNEV